MLYTVATTAGEGHIDRLALNRAATFNSQKALLLASEWFQKPGLLDVFGGTPVRASYDCAPKRYRAQFLCLINRLLLVEARQFGDGHIRAGWNSIMQNFPELALWREFREHLQLHVWDNSKDPKNDTRVYADEAVVFSILGVEPCHGFYKSQTVGQREPSPKYPGDSMHLVYTEVQQKKYMVLFLEYYTPL